MIIAHHHPAYTAGGRDGWSETMLKQINPICQQTDVWLHAVLSRRAHNSRRFVRLRSTQSPYILCGNRGHGLVRLRATGRCVHPRC